MARFFTFGGAKQEPYLASPIRALMLPEGIIGQFALRVEVSVGRRCRTRPPRAPDVLACPTEDFDF